MKLIHEVDPAVNYFPMYSVEWLPETSEHNCWNQHGLTQHKTVARLMRFETWLRHGRSSRIRVRVL